jgi:hypothetical protein
LSTPFAEEAAQAATMMAESLAGEWDTAVEDLVADNSVLRKILEKGRGELAGTGNDKVADTVKEIESALSTPRAMSFRVSDLTAENESLRAGLASLLESLEDLETRGEGREVRRDAYRHLRRVAVRGWSFFDVSGFRERIVQARAELDQSDESVRAR